MRRARVKEGTEYLLIDVSNSFTKLACASRARVERCQRLPTQSLDRPALEKILREREPRKVIISSVVPAKNGPIRRAAGDIQTLFVSARSPLGIGIDYPRPETIGADRLANAAAVSALYGVPAIVIDFGTAVTFDLVSVEHAYIGGVIAPGLEAMSNFLYRRTALLPRISLREPRRAVGRSTYEAMLAGAVIGYRGLVREILRQIVQEKFPRKKVHIVATGGYARLLARQLPEVGVVRENLTLEGLRLIGNLEK